MGETLNQMLDNYLNSSNVQLKKGPNSVDFLIDSAEGTSRTSIYTIFPNVHLIYFDIHALSLPGEIEANAAYHPLQFNYCISGRIELLLEDDTHLYLKENDFCISRDVSQNESYFPAEYYHGITVYFEPEFFTHSNRNMAEIFDLNLSRLQEIYFEKKDTYIAEANSEIHLVLSKLWKLHETSSLFHMKLYILELLHLLLDEKNLCQEKTCTFYTSIQVEIAKQTEQILTSNLQKHISIRLLANQFSVSETSLKNYFRGVYGKNISTYLRDIRMRTAAKLLIETKLPISEISSQIGYTKQGKFAEIFKLNFYMRPLEYRRANQLEKCKSLYSSEE